MLGNYGALSPSVSCLSVSWGVPDMLGGASSEGRGLGWKPRVSLSLRAWLHVLLATPAHLSLC